MKKKIYIAGAGGMLGEAFYRVFNDDFAKNVKKIIDKEFWGLYNLVCDGQTSRREVAEELVSILGLEKSVVFHDVTSDYFKEIYFAQRPVSERLINKKLDLRNLNIMQDWKIALKEYIDMYFADFLADKLEQTK